MVGQLTKKNGHLLVQTLPVGHHDCHRDEHALLIAQRDRGSLAPVTNLRGLPITDLVTTVLGPLSSARGGARPSLDTLAVLFDNQGNHAATARQMHLSVRAVTYRLDRIRDLTGEPTQRFTPHAAVLGARLLGWPDDPTTA